MSISLYIHSFIQIFINSFIFTHPSIHPPIINFFGTRCSSVVEIICSWDSGSLDQSLMVDPLCSMTGVTKAVVCAVLWDDPTRGAGGPP